MRGVIAGESCTVRDTPVSRVEFRRNCRKIIRSGVAFAVQKRDAGRERLPRRFAFYRAGCMWGRLLFWLLRFATERLRKG